MIEGHNLLKKGIYFLKEMNGVLCKSMGGGRDIRHKYNYKNKIPKKKIWKVRNTRRNVQQIRRKKKLLPKDPTAWKLLTTLLFISLITIIIIIPTLIVAPFVKGNHHQSTIHETEFQLDSEPDSSTVSVSVMRLSTEEVENVPLETYVTRVLASEMPAEFEMEALKAQGLAARTYIVNHLLYQNEEANAHITDSTTHQVYKNEEELRKQWGSEYKEKLEKLQKAVESTKGEILTYNKQPITAAYFSTSNGYTENSEDYWDNEIPYLRSVESPWDKESPVFLDQEVFSIQEVEKALEITLPHNSSIPIELSRTDSQRVKQLKIFDHVFTGREVREKLALKSSDFTIKQNNDYFVFTTKGYGHGIGMSQYGANGMAKEGKTYKDIVKHYYKDIEISTVEEIAPTLVLN